MNHDNVDLKFYEETTVHNLLAWLESQDFLAGSLTADQVFAVWKDDRSNTQ